MPYLPRWKPEIKRKVNCIISNLKKKKPVLSEGNATHTLQFCEKSSVIFFLYFC